MSRIAVVKGTASAGINGAITLAILLIAPMGLAAVITNTFLIMLASFLTTVLVDRVAVYLQGTSSSQLPSQTHPVLPLKQQDQPKRDHL